LQWGKEQLSNLRIIVCLQWERSTYQSFLRDQLKNRGGTAHVGLQKAPSLVMSAFDTDGHAQICAHSTTSSCSTWIGSKQGHSTIGVVASRRITVAQERKVQCGRKCMSGERVHFTYCICSHVFCMSGLHLSLESIFLLHNAF
jgi:hypothetical protein